MNWEPYFNQEALPHTALAVLAGVAVAALAFVLRRIFYRYIHRLASNTKTPFNDILLHDTRLVTLLWCIWPGLYTIYRIAVRPEDTAVVNQIAGIIFMVLAAYTIVVIVNALLRWYRRDISKTSWSLENFIAGFLVFAVPVIITALLAVGILNHLNVNHNLLTSVNAWLETHLASLATLFLLTVVLLLMIRRIVPRLIRNTVYKTHDEQTEEDMRKRIGTLTGVITTGVQMVVIFIFVTMILSEFDYNISALLTSAGVIALAISLGAQSLIKDLISGFFIIVENHYRIGDYIKIASVAGTVESINLRKTVLRDSDGALHVVPSSAISVASNYTNKLSRINFSVSVDYDTNIEKAIEVINRVGQDMLRDPVWSKRLRTAPRVTRVDKLSDTGIDLLLGGDTYPGKQWESMGELRLRLNKAFKAEGIMRAVPLTKLSFENPPTPPPLS
ncbi:MAG: mechanosensitive ion channel family protein [Dehalococcoidia bacterium]|nr:mechanosensitive ion channel family protein [Dehalococcoidia bacterium]